ncbi:MAG: cobalt-precorrin 5A hydrolase [Desulfobulbaceae bacterium]|nr:cobalt-precorrin 5A hydrolase [Desulfobulbaceae bacterium]
MEITEQNIETKVAILSLTQGGHQLAIRLAEHFPGATPLHCRGTVRSTVKKAWTRYDALIFIMATGIAVRTIAPLLRDKYHDPAVVVCDEAGHYAISLLSGHLGGANELANQVARTLNGQAIITTASDVLGRTALDIWIKDNNLTVHQPKGLAVIMGRLVNNGFITLYSDYPLPPLPPDIQHINTIKNADLVITSRTEKYLSCFVLIPKSLVVGIGCNRGVSAKCIERACTEVFADHGLFLNAIRNLASIDIKADERGLLDFAAGKGYEIDFFSSSQLNEVANISESQAVLRATGAKGVAEPASILSAGNHRLIVRKVKCKDVTIAVTEVHSPWSEPDLEPSTS